MKIGINDIKRRIKCEKIMKKTPLEKKLSKLGLTEKDFDVTIYEDINHTPFYIYEDEDDPGPFPSIFVKINGIICAKLSRSMVNHIKNTPGFDAIKIVKLDAIDWYLNNPKEVRKEKLEKIIKKYES